MKGEKCIKFLALFITLLVGLGISSKNTNALLYNIGTIDFYEDSLESRRIYDNYSDSYVFGYFPNGNNFSIAIPSNAIPDGFEYPHVWHYTGNYHTDTGVCSLPTTGTEPFYDDGVFSQEHQGYGYTLYQLDNLSNARGSFYILSENFFEGYFSPIYLGSPTWRDPLPTSFDASSPFTINQYCDIHGQSYIRNGDSIPPADTNMPTFDFSSLINIPLVNNRYEYQKSKPYGYQFDKLYIRGTRKVDGIVQSKDTLSSSDIFKKPVTSFNYLGMNFDLFNSIETTIDDDWALNNEDIDLVNYFELGGTLRFPSDFILGSDATVIMSVDDYYDPDFDSSLYIQEGDKYYFGDTLMYDLASNPHLYQNNQNTHHDITCHLDEVHQPDSHYLNFTCRYDPSLYSDKDKVNFLYTDVSLTFSGTSDGAIRSDLFVSTGGDWQLETFYIVTNDDITPARIDATVGSWGGNPSSAPGGTDGVSGGYENDFLSSLKDMFTFGFINPFSPIFDLFSNNNSCVNIPTLAGMLHSEETQVCPWFSSSTRNIVTPVLGISSMMLVFGFAVRWLGARSGNFIEDSGEHDAGGLRVQSKYRRNK